VDAAVGSGAAGDAETASSPFEPPSMRSRRSWRKLRRICQVTWSGAGQCPAAAFPGGIASDPAAERPVAGAKNPTLVDAAMSGWVVNTGFWR